jgi:hypothetical protein
MDRTDTSRVRIRIGEILKQHPEFIGKQVIEKLGPSIPFG